MRRQQPLLKLLDELKVLYTDLNHVITEYDIKLWETSAFTSWEQKGNPIGMLSYQEHLYICQWNPSSLGMYNIKNGEKLIEKTSFQSPCGIDYNLDKNLLFIADKNNMTTLTFKLDIISSWRLPSDSGVLRGLKFNNDILYLTTYGVHNIFLCHQDGRLFQKWGSQVGSSNELYYNPSGLTVNNKYVYICDSTNRRIKIVRKDNGQFINKWGNIDGVASTKIGEFKEPFIIYHHVSEDIFYVGDYYSCQLFLSDGSCLQRIGDIEQGRMMNQFDEVWGISIYDNQLFINDSYNHRIQIFNVK